MKIDFNRLILLLLPVRLRTVVLFSVLRVLMSPIVSLYVDLQAYMTNRRRRASATPQAMSIQAIVYAETGVSIRISPNNDANSLSPDFYVSYADDATPAEVTAAKYVITRYKLVGKSYEVKGADIPFIKTWSGASCVVEAIQATDSHGWSDNVCAVYVAESPVNEIGVIINTSRKSAYIRASSAVTSNLVVSILIEYDSMSPPGEVVVFQIQSGLTISPTVTFNVNANMITAADAISIDPQSDANYTYQFTGIINN